MERALYRLLDIRIFGHRHSGKTTRAQSAKPRSGRLLHTPHLSALVEPPAAGVERHGHTAPSVPQGKYSKRKDACRLLAWRIKNRILYRRVRPKLLLGAASTGGTCIVQQAVSSVAATSAHVIP